MAASPSPRSIWRQPRFLTFWLASTVSAIGTEVSAVALPLTAVVLGAGPLHMGILRAAVSISDLLIGPLAGAWVDRVRRRPLLIASDLGRAILLSIVPVAALFGVLRIEHVLAIALLAGALTTLGKIAERSFLVSVVSRPQLLDANGALSTGRSVAEVVGPGLGGVLVQALTAPLAVAADAASFLLSALGVGLTRTDEQQPRRDSSLRRSIWSEAGEGVRFVLSHQTLRRIVIGVGIFALFDSAFFGLYVLYVSRDLGVGPGELGLIFVLGGVGGTLGAIVAGQIARRLGLGRTVVWALMVAGAGDMLIPWVSLLPALTVPLLGFAEFVVTFGVSVFMVNETTLRQQITPDALQGRMHATIGLIVGGCNAIGALGGGLIAEYVGVRPLLIVAATATILSGLWLLTTSVRRLQAVDVDRPG
jgi:predicted MFS family arabinose efflux permease